jgi:carboxymethylenebutenolidase
MIHEWWGLNDNVRAMADRLAAEGYIVLAVDLFDGDVAPSAGAARQLMLRVVENQESASENIRQAYDWVSKTAGAPRIGSLGWCFGGGWSLNAAKLFPDDLDAAVIYYGQVTDNEEELRPLNMPILGLFGDADTGIKVESVQAFAAALERLRIPHDIHIYPGAQHAFANPTGTAYNAAAADDAWEKTLAFLQENLVDTASEED